MPTPSAAPSSLEMIRVVVSVPLPAANGSTSVMLRVGQAGACASAADVKPANAMTARREVSEIILFPSPELLLICVIRHASLLEAEAEARFRTRHADAWRDAITTPARSEERRVG